MKLSFASLSVIKSLTQCPLSVSSEVISNIHHIVKPAGCLDTGKKKHNHVFHPVFHLSNFTEIIVPTTRSETPAEFTVTSPALSHLIYIFSHSS